MHHVDFNKLPLGTSNFEALRELDQIYVDKTKLIFSLASSRKKFFLNRPRRFGKSLLISTFESLFKNGLKDFHGLAIENLWKETRQYLVVRLDFSDCSNFTSLKEFQNQFDEHLSSQFGEAGFQQKKDSEETVLTQLSEWLQTLPNNSLVLLIDEYDCPLTASLQDNRVFEFVRTKVASFLSKIKSNDRILRFFFMTGITKFSQKSIFSELNDLIDISLQPEYGALLGYTEH